MRRLPVLLLNSEGVTAAEIEKIVRDVADAIVCAPMMAAGGGFGIAVREGTYGVSLPSSAFEAENSNGESVAARCEKQLRNCGPR